MLASFDWRVCAGRLNLSAAARPLPSAAHPSVCCRLFANLREPDHAQNGDMIKTRNDRTESDGYCAQEMFLARMLWVSQIRHLWPMVEASKGSGPGLIWPKNPIADLQEA